MWRGRSATQRTVTPTNNGLFRTSCSMRGVRVPNVAMILNNWSMSESPGNNGIPVFISASMQPTAHMSTGLPYDCNPAAVGEQRHTSNSNTPHCSLSPGRQPTTLETGTNVWRHNPCTVLHYPSGCAQNQSRTASVFHSLKGAGSPA